MSRLQLRRWIARSLPWVLLIVALLLVSSQARRPAAVMQLWRPWAEIGMLASVMTAIILTGGIDLSVGSTIALSSMVLGLLWRDHGFSIEAAAAGAVVAGGLAGALNGCLVTAGIAPLVATLATMALYAGLAKALAEESRVSDFPENFMQWGQGSLLGLPNQVWCLAVALGAAYLMVHHTRFGRYLYAIGDNRLAADFAALPRRRIEWSLYFASGLMAGIVAVIYTARGGAAIPNAGVGRELETIACVVVGGTLVTGGQGGIGRTLLGVAVMSHLDIGLQLLGSREIPVFWSDVPWRIGADVRLILVGVLLIAVAIWNERLAATRE